MPLPTHKVTICGIPELSLHCSVGVSHVLSIIDTHEPRPPALDHYSAIEHELIRFDDVVAEYPGFEACTPAHIVKVLEFGERVHARPDSHVLVHCHAGISRSTAAAAILMCQHAPGQEEAAFLKLLGMRKHGWPNTRMVEFADTLLWWVALGWDGAMMIGETLKAVGPKNDDIVGYWNKVKGWPGIYGTVTWTPEQHNGFPDEEVVMCEVNSLRDGAFNIAPGYSS